MHTSPLLQILDLARWAPSGDNTQPWRFEIVDEYRFVIHGHDTREHCVYDLDGRPSQLSIGAMIETAAIAATAHSLRLEVARRQNSPEARPLFDARLVPDASLQPSALIEAIPRRSVQRKPFRTAALAPAQRQALDAALPYGYRLRWLDTPALRRQAARLMFANARIRLMIPEAYEVHRQIIQWGARYSEDRVPSQALGVDALSEAMMRFAMHSWRRISFLNRYAAGTVLPRLQMDWWPALRCAAHLAIVADDPPNSLDDYVAAGRAVQRLWLTITQQGLQHQPEITPLVFGRYARERRSFTAHPGAAEQAARLAADLDALLSGAAERVVWIGRVGHGPTPLARSGRLPLSRLLLCADGNAVTP